MASLTDDQLVAILGTAWSQNPDSYMGVGIGLEGHAMHIREMSALTDDQMRKWLRDSASTDPVMREIFEDATKKKMVSDINKMAKDIKGDPRKFARKVDKELDY